MERGLVALGSAELQPSAPLLAGQPAVLIVDDDRRCVEANEVATELLGFRRGEVVGRRFDALVAEGMRERIEHIWRAFQEQGGNAGPFTLEAGGEIQISMTPNLLPGRHLLVLSPLGGQAAAPPSPAEPLPGTVRVPRGRKPSSREREVLRLLAGGATDPQIAEMLGLSPATIQTHVRNAKAKLGARTRAQAVAMAIADGLIDV